MKKAEANLLRLASALRVVCNLLVTLFHPLTPQKLLLLAQLFAQN